MKAYLVFIALLFSDAFTKPITINVLSDLSIGTLLQGDPVRVIPPSNQETPENASFEVRGDKNQAYTILLPASASLTSSGGGDSLSLSNFTSFPATGGGLLDNKGKQNLYVGASVGPVSTTQTSGNYTGSFLVEVIY